MPQHPDLCLAPVDPGLSIREVTYQPGQEQPLHFHEETSLSLVYRGTLREQVGKAQVWAGPLSFVVKPAGTLHANRFGPNGAGTIQLTLAAAFAADEAMCRSGLGRWRWIHGGSVARRVLSIWREHRLGSDPWRLENASVELMDALEDDCEEPFGGTPPPWLRRVKQQIELTFFEGIRVRQLARDAGVHPVSLSRCFRRHYGSSVTEYLQHLRVETAARLLSGARLAIAEVAQKSGYADQSHLCREFKSKTGFTPSLYRRLAGQE